MALYVAGEGVYILREFLGHNFVSGLRTFTSKQKLNIYKPENLKTYKKLFLI